MYLARTDVSPPIPFTDTFTEDVRPGQVIGTAVPGPGPSRRRVGADVEGSLSVDGHALRLRPLARPGWGRATLAYGPYDRQPGLSAAFVLLNSHHASEHAEAWPPLGSYLKQVLRGTQVDALPHRLLHRPRYRARETLLRRARAWRGHRQVSGDPDAATNLAIGWLGSPAPTTATGGGQGLVIRSAHGENGELLAEVAGGRALVQDRLQNLPLYVLVVLRDHGATYWAASLPGAAGLPGLPVLRPLVLDGEGDAARVWAGVQPRVSGQVGWSIDSRLHCARVARPTTWSSWWTTAHAADRPVTGRPGHDDAAARGGSWSVAGDLALLAPGSATGLVRAVVAAGDEPVGLVLRADTGGHHLQARISLDQVALLRCAPGAAPVTLAAADLCPQERDDPPGRPVALDPPGRLDLQVVDDGARVRVLVDGRLVLGPVDVGRVAASATGVGLWIPASGRAVHEIEAHPLALVLPPELALDPLPVPHGDREVLAVDFTAPDLGPRADLGGLLTASGTAWERTVGARAFSLGATGVLVPPPEDDGPRRPLTRVVGLLRGGGERLAYTVPWPDPALADVTVTIAPPGTGRHQGQGSRAGLVFWQDDDTCLIVNTWLDDAYDGTSISSFLRVRGYEDVFDAVWTNVGRRVTWGQPFRLRTCFDGVRHTTWVDDEPVLYRATRDVLPQIERMRITRVGLVANWEFGQDTGSRFLALRASTGAGRNPTSANLTPPAADH